MSCRLQLPVFSHVMFLQLVQFTHIHVCLMFWVRQRVQRLAQPRSLATAFPPQHTKHSVGFTGLALWVYATLVVLGGWVGSLHRCARLIWSVMTGSYVWWSVTATTLGFDSWRCSFLLAGFQQLQQMPCFEMECFQCKLDFVSSRFVVISNAFLFVVLAVVFGLHLFLNWKHLELWSNGFSLQWIFLNGTFSTFGFTLPFGESSLFDREHPAYRV
jgi:hypothetical protein